MIDEDGSSVDGDDGSVAAGLALAGRLVEKVPLLRRHGEVIATAALAAMLDHRRLREVFESLLGIEAGSGTRWITEHVVTDDDRWGRADLVREGPGGRRVMVETKFAHHMAAEQLELYASPSDVSLVVLLVPSHRQAAARALLADASMPSGADADVVTWEQVIETFQDVSAQDVAAEVRQFASLVRALSGPVIEPFGDNSPQQLLDEREDDLALVVDYATSQLQRWFIPDKRLLPMARGRDATFLIHRYVETIVGGMHFAVGVASRDTDASILWLRYHSGTAGFADLNPEVLEPSRPVRNWEGHLWVALTLPRSPDLGGMVAALCDEVTDIHTALTGHQAQR